MGIALFLAIVLALVVALLAFGVLVAGGWAKLKNEVVEGWKQGRNI